MEWNMSWNFNTTLQNYNFHREKTQVTAVGGDKNNTTNVWTRGRWQHTQNKHQCHIVWKQKQKVSKYHRSICSCSLLFCGGIMTEKDAPSWLFANQWMETHRRTFAIHLVHVHQELLVHFDKLTCVGMAFFFFCTLHAHLRCINLVYQPISFSLPILLLHLVLFTWGLNGTLIIIIGNTRVTTWQYGFIFNKC